MQNVNGRCFSDKIYWQVADQPGKEGPNFLVMVDLVDKEENKGLSSSKGRGRGGRENVKQKISTYHHLRETCSDELIEVSGRECNS